MFQKIGSCLDVLLMVGFGCYMLMKAKDAKAAMETPEQKKRASTLQWGGIALVISASLQMLFHLLPKN